MNQKADALTPALHK